MVRVVCTKNNNGRVFIAKEPLSRLKFKFLSAKVLGAGAMVTYLKLRVQGIQELVQLCDEGPSALSECLHHLAGIMPGNRVLGHAL